MKRRTAVAAAWLVVSGCSMGEADLPGSPPAAGSPPVTQASQSAPLTGDPFTPVLSGHRLAIAGDVAIVADPEGPTEDGLQPQVHLASISRGHLLSSLTLPAGANPQAVAVSTDGYAYVLAAGLGGVFAVDLARQTLGAFSQVCSAPADLATRGGDVLVACRGGELVTLTQQGKQTQQLDAALVRIAVDAQNRVFVATQSAEIITVGQAGAIAPQEVLIPGTPRVEHANTPRRLVPLQSGVAMLYQQSLSGELSEGDPNGTGGLPPTDNLDGGTIGGQGGGDGSGNPYAGAGPCALPATRPTTTTFDPATGGFTGQHWSLSTLAIDAAASPDGTTLAVADPAGGGVLMESLSSEPTNVQDDTCFSNSSVDFTTKGFTATVPLEAPGAVAYAGNTLVVLNTAPNLELATITAGALAVSGPRIALRARVLSEGFKLFHQDPQPASQTQNAMLFGATHSSLACASCHPDGLTNGATTTLNGVTRRVMPLAGRLANATLVHWEGEDFHTAVAEHTWHQNMGGTELTPSQETSLRAFVGQLKLPGRPAADAVQIALGRAAFDKAGCGGCHVEATAFTNNSVADVGRGLHKVPSLAGLVYTAPYMSDGCAATLEARFDDVACGGGAQHGNVAALSTQERAALIAFLKTL